MGAFEWDPEKNAANIQKHGLSFEEAASIFSGPVLTGLDENFRGVQGKELRSVGRIGRRLRRSHRSEWKASHHQRPQGNAERKKAFR